MRFDFIVHLTYIASKNMSFGEDSLFSQYVEKLAKSLRTLADKLEKDSRYDADVVRSALSFLEEQDAAFHRGLAEVCYENQDWVGSVVHFTKCSLYNPEDFNSMFYLASSYKNLGLFSDAIVNYKKSLEICEYPEGLLNLSSTYSDVSDHGLELKTLEHLILSFPNFTLGHYNYGILCYRKRDISRSIQCFNKALETDPNHGESRVALSLALLMDKQYVEGFKMHDSRWGVSPNCPVREFNRPYWCGQPVQENSSILVTLEQGFGDMFQMIRYLPLLSEKFAKISIEVQPQMSRLVMMAYPQVEVIVHGKPLPDTDFYCPVMSLPRAFGTTYQTIPRSNKYIQIPCDERFNLAFDKDLRKKIGICWRGGMLNPQMAHRSLTASVVKKLFEDYTYTWVSLNKELPESEREELRCTSNFMDLTHALVDFYDTYQLISCLDLVITVDTAVAHLAGAMGKPTIVILNEGYDWRWHINDENSAWYPNTRLLRAYELDSYDALVPNLLAILKQG